MNYRIIHDEQALREFIDWLPELDENETYYLSVFARKKYCAALIKSNDKTQVKRFTSNKERMFDKIKQLEVPLGSLKLRDMDAPQESLVVYIHPNPRSNTKACNKMLKHCADLITNTARGYNLHAEAMSCIQKSKSRTCFVHFDIDTKDVNLSLINEVLPAKSYSIVETRGGYHLLVDTRANLPKRNWFYELEQLLKPEQTGDMMLPVPGTIQGEFIPKTLVYSEYTV